MRRINCTISIKGVLNAIYRIISASDIVNSIDIMREYDQQKIDAPRCQDPFEKAR
jgi:hypothetical protein